MTESFKERLKGILVNDFFAAFLFLVVYVCTNSYVYGWDNQHLEIPLLKHLIDPSLYRGDYYVESLARNFSSFLYPILARFITVDEVPATYFILFLVFRFFIFLGLYKLWRLISGDKFSAVCAVLMFMLLGRTEEFLWRTFSHETVAQCLVFAGLYLFYKERFLLAALIFGLATNIDAIYSLLGMAYMLTFLLFFGVRRWGMICKTSFIFILGSLPFLFWQVPRSLQERAGHAALSPSEWLPLYSVSCPQNFLFAGTTLQQVWSDKGTIISQMEPFLFLVLVYLFLFLVYPDFRKDKKTNVLIGTALALFIFSNFFTYIIPSRFVLDLNLIRNEQFVRLFLMSYVTFWAVKTVKEAKYWQALMAALMFYLIGVWDWSDFFVKVHKDIWTLAAMGVVFIILISKRWPKLDIYLRKSLIVVPLAGSFIFYCIFNYNYQQVKDHGLEPWQLLRNWDDMQHYVHDHTAKDALIMTPIDTPLGGFRINSERRVLVDDRDCGIVGFDYQAAVEWQNRIKDIDAFRVLITKPINQAVIMAIVKYRVDYIVFMKYYAPSADGTILKKIYQNEVFSLFQVLVHPPVN